MTTQMLEQKTEERLVESQEEFSTSLSQDELLEAQQENAEKHAGRVPGKKTLMEMINNPVG